MADQCVFIRGFGAKRALFGIRVFSIGSDKGTNRAATNLGLFFGLRNEASPLGNASHIGGSSSSLDTIVPTNHESLRTRNRNFGLRNELSPLGDSHIGRSSSSLDTIVSINHENPQLLPYPSSITLPSNGSIYSTSFMTSPSDDSLEVVLNHIAEVCLPRHECSI